jgi:hypothetical protein
MKNGIYEVKFTTNVGTLGTAAVLIKNQSLVGADGMQFYRGTFEENGRNVTLLMEVTRHNFAIESAFGREALFTLKWDGETSNETEFRASCRAPGSDVVVYVVGRLLQTTD